MVSGTSTGGTHPEMLPFDLIRGPMLPSCSFRNNTFACLIKCLFMNNTDYLSKYMYNLWCLWGGMLFAGNQFIV